MSYLENMITECKNRNKELIEENTLLEERIKEYELKFNTYTKEQTQLLFKIQQVKSELYQQDLKMTGYNSYKDYNYFELKDLLPCTVKLLVKHNLSSFFFVKEGNMYLQIIDAGTGAWIQWHTPLKEVARSNYPKGDIGVLMKDQQALHTYARRTLWLLVLELIEPNSIEKDTTGSSQKPATKDTVTIPEDTDPVIKDVFQQIRKDFGKKVVFNETTIKNKLVSMKKAGKIDADIYKRCLEVIE